MSEETKKNEPAKARLIRVKLRRQIAGRKAGDVIDTSRAELDGAQLEDGKDYDVIGSLPVQGVPAKVEAKA